MRLFTDTSKTAEYGLIKAKKLCGGSAELFAGRGEKGGLFVLMNDNDMIAGMVSSVAQLNYTRTVIHLTLVGLTEQVTSRG